MAEEKKKKDRYKTIDLKGKKYVQVQERVRVFNEDYKNGKIVSSPTIMEKTVIFKAVVHPEVKDKERFFVGHSFGNLEKEKALEKLETVAVGRALAFMGIGILEGIASADEVEKFKKGEKKYPSKLASGKQIEFINRLCSSQGITVEKLSESTGLDMKKLTSKQASELIDKMVKKVEGQLPQKSKAKEEFNKGLKKTKPVDDVIIEQMEDE